MKKGLNVTLLTVAIAVMAFQAMAMAPTILDIKSPIVGSDEGATGPTAFVYVDAFDITSKATDDSTTPANIRWSYYYAGNEIYRINNVPRVTVSPAAINNPGTALINGTTKDPLDPNTAPTITIRNVKYAPIGGSITMPTATGIIDPVTVTLFASDGTTYSQKEVFFYTDNGGFDRLSTGQPTGGPTWAPGLHQTTFPTQGTTSWTWAYLIGTISSASTSSGSAICIETAAQGQNYASWNSSWGIFSVAKNTVYRIRARVNGTQTQVERSPFFDLVVGNFSLDGTKGLNLFGGDLMIFDNEGGANAPMLKTGGGTDYRFYWAPSCLTSSTFNSSTVWTTNAENRKMMMTFRVMDLNNIGGADPLTANNDSGVLCLNDLQIDSIPYDSLATTPVWSLTSGLSSSNMQAIDYVGTMSYDAGKLKINTTATGAATSTYGNAYPGDATMSLTNFDTYTDNFPVAWESNTLYKVTWQWSAVDAAAAAAPLDVIYTGMDCPSNEFILNSYVTSQEGKAAMPKTGTAQDYVAFFWSGTVSATSHNQWKRLRPRAEWANSTVLTESASNGNYYIHGCKVEKVTNP